MPLTADNHISSTDLQNSALMATEVVTPQRVSHPSLIAQSQTSTSLSVTGHNNSNNARKLTTGSRSQICRIIDVSSKKCLWSSVSRFGVSSSCGSIDGINLGKSGNVAADHISRWCAVKLIQFFVIGLLVYVFWTVTLCKPQSENALLLRTNSLGSDIRSNARKPLSQSVATFEDQNEIFYKLKTSFKRPKWAKVVISPNSICRGGEGHPKVLILVHSRPNNRKQRELIRQTWGSVKSLSDNSKVDTVFVLGESFIDSVTPTPYLKSQENKFNQFNNHRSKLMSTISVVSDELSEYDDLLIGNFMDTYKNLTVKHEFGVRWASEHCYDSSVILKSDDDAFIDLHGLMKFLNRTFGSIDLINTIACDVIPKGTEVMRVGKWAVPNSVYPSTKYPQYCSGLAYVMPVSVAEKLVKEVAVTDWVWVDDAWFTGILAQNLHLRFLKLNARFCYDQSVVSNWEEHHTTGPPCMVIHLDSNSWRFGEILKKLWDHSVMIHERL